MKTKCFNCQGKGVEYSEYHLTNITCQVCNGTGKIDKKAEEIVEKREEGKEDGPLTKWLMGLIGTGIILYLIFS